MNSVVLFQGQGSYRTYYIRELIEKKKELILLWEKADDILGWSLLDLLLQTEDVGALPTNQAQPMIFMMEYTAWCAYKDELVKKPKYLAGHSLGELVALAAAEACSFEDSLRLVQARGDIMLQFSCKSNQGMISLQNCSAQKAEALCDEARKKTGKDIFCANYNSLVQTVVSGEREALDYIKSIPHLEMRELKVTKAFHTPLMRGAAEKYKEYLNDITFSYPQIAVVSNVIAKPYQTSWSINQLLYEQIFSPVRWNDTMDYFKDKGMMVYLQATNSKLFRNMDVTSNQFYQWGSLEELISNQILDFDRCYFEAYEDKSRGEELCGEILKTMLSFPWDSSNENDFTKAKEAYQKVKNLSKEIDLSKEQVSQCMDTLKDTLFAKGLSKDFADQFCNDLLNKYRLCI